MAPPVPSDNESDDFQDVANSTLVEEEKKEKPKKEAGLCKFCKKTAPTEDSIACKVCLAPMHYTCRGIPTHSNTRRPTSVVQKMLAAPWATILCDECSASSGDSGSAGPALPAAAQVAVAELRTIKATLASLTQSVQAQQASINSFLGPQPGAGDSSDGWTQATKRRRSAGKDATPGLARVVTATLAVANQEEKRLRTAIIDGLDSTPGVRDEDTLNELLSFLGLAESIRVVECVRVGKGTETSPPKLKVIFHSREAQKAFVAKETRTKLTQPDCPPSFASIYINPSRTQEEQKRLHLLRKRRDHLNAPIPAKENHWFLDYNQQVLVKRIGGNADWRGPGDAGMEEWIKSIPDTAAAVTASSPVIVVTPASNVNVKPPLASSTPSTSSSSTTQSKPNPLLNHSVKASLKN